MSVLLAPANGVFFNPTEQERIKLLLASEFFLLRNDASGTGERYRCGRCRGKHTHFTLMCIERPFDRAGVQKMYLTGRVNRRTVPVSPLARLGIRDLAEQHPRTARALAPGEAGEHWFAYLLGTAEPISARRAQALADRIRAAGAATFTLQPLDAVRRAAPVLEGFV